MGGGIVAGKIAFVTGGWQLRRWLKVKRCAILKVVGGLPDSPLNLSTLEFVVKTLEDLPRMAKNLLTAQKSGGEINRLHIERS
jgi:hypothetical protein